MASTMKQNSRCTRMLERIQSYMSECCIAVVIPSVLIPEGDLSYYAAHGLRLKSWVNENNEIEYVVHNARHGNENKGNAEKRGDKTDVLKTGNKKR